MLFRSMASATSRIWRRGAVMPREKKGVLKALFVLSIITVVISLLPLMYGLNYYTLVGALITVTLVIESILAKIQQK